MKKTLCMVLALVLLVGATVVPCMAVAAGGVCDVTVETGFTMKEYSSSSEVKVPLGILIGAGKSNFKTYYAGTEKVTLSYDCEDNTVQHLVFLLKGDTVLPTGENIAYIWQTTADSGKVNFTIYPNELTAGPYTVCISKTGDSAITKAASFTAADQNDVAEPVLGDINNDGKINSDDALLALRHSVSLIKLQGSSFLAGDVAHDEKVNSDDALQILRHSVGLIDTF